MSEFELLERFKSRKNGVYRVRVNGETKVLKIFSSSESLDREYKMLDLLKDRLNVPRVHSIDRRRGMLVMEFIEGENLCDLVNSTVEHDIADSLRIIEKLARWFSDFHLLLKDKQMVRGDSILRNFILDYKGEIHGVDFEESRRGRVEEDIAEICISVLTTHPEFTEEKFELCKRFLKAYSGDIDVPFLGKQMFKTLEKFSIRRGDVALKDTGVKEMKKHGLIWYLGDLQKERSI